MNKRVKLVSLVATLVCLGCGRDPLQIEHPPRCERSQTLPGITTPPGLAEPVPSCNLPPLIRGAEPGIAALVRLILGREAPERTAGFLERGLTFERAADRTEIIEALLTDALALEHADGWLAQWLEIPVGSPSPMRFTAELWSDLREQTLRHGRDVFLQAAPLPSLLLADTTFANDEVATFYGFSPPSTGDTFAQVKVPAPRVGVLGHAAVLGRLPSVSARGSFLFRRMTSCEALPEPPAGEVHAMPPQTLASRESWRQTQEGACAGCHAMMDAGFALHRFDERGLLRQREPNGSRIDDRARVLDAAGNEDVVTGLPELAAALESRGMWRRCLAGAILEDAGARTGLNFATSVEGECAPAVLLAETWRKDRTASVAKVLTTIAGLMAGGSRQAVLSGPAGEAPREEPATPPPGDDEEGGGCDDSSDDF